MDDLNKKRLETLLRHIKNVRENCEILGERLIESGSEELGIKLIANGLIHDYSKFSGIEWLYLHQDVKDSDPELFKMASHQHITNNLHHPESWVGGISEMDPLHLSELTCDWRSRSQEFGDDLWEWVKVTARKKYKYSLKGRVYGEIKKFLELLLEPKFK